MRIIRGKYGRRRFQVPSSFKARPTTDFAKENVFNVLENQICWDGLVALDLFAGTGGISFELLSRGCQHVTAVELDFAHAGFIDKVAKELKVDNFELIRGDAFRYLRSVKTPFDFIFADPPYALAELSDLPRLVIEENLLAENGLFVLEHPKQYNFSSQPCFSQQRAYGSVNFSFFLKKSNSL